MKIDPLSAGRLEKPRRRAGADANTASDFSEVLQGGEPQRGTPASANAASPLDALLSLQEVTPEPISRQAAEQHGKALLDELDRLRHQLLNGNATPEVLTRLSDMASARKGEVQDPRLREIIEEIELRAAVELAKYGH